MIPVRKYNNQNWLPSIFNDFFDNNWMVKTNATAPAINVEEDKENKKYLRREFSYTKFQQALILPEDVEKDNISASVSEGVLTIDLPKRQPEEKAKVSRQIEIH